MKFVTLGARRYGFHSPKGLTKSPALVIALHGGGLGSPEQHERMTGWTSLADRDRGLVVVYPQGIKAAWNAGNGALGYAGRMNLGDVGFLETVIRDAAIRFAVDPARVYLSGFSNGSMLAHWFAVQCPGVVAAIGAVSGGLSAIPREGLHGAPAVRIVHGYQGDHVPFEGGVGAAALDPYDHVAIGRTEAWWRAQVAEVVTRYGAWGHTWPDAETAEQWTWMRGERL